MAVDIGYVSLSTRADFNKALRHFKIVNYLVGVINSRQNVADIINDALSEGIIARKQIPPIINALLVDKFSYSYSSFNLVNTISEFDKVVEETSKWTAMDFVVMYYHPQVKFFVINPKNRFHWSEVEDIAKHHLLVIYAKYIGSSKIDMQEIKTIEQEAINSLYSLINQEDVFVNQNFIDRGVKVQVAEEKPKKRKQQITPKYAVEVTNELFHNGNVEAWKNIIESYLEAHPGTTVRIYYDGELVEDINSLFKWGKVRTGDVIFFRVAGEDIKDVSKLRRYLFEGASPRFEAFLKKDPGRILKLF